MKQKRRGRPTGFKMTKKSKQKIAQSRTGQKHSEETKQKISQSVINYWLNKENNNEEA